MRAGTAAVFVVLHVGQLHMQTQTKDTSKLKWVELRGYIYASISSDLPSSVKKTLLLDNVFSLFRNGGVFSKNALNLSL